MKKALLVNGQGFSSFIKMKKCHFEGGVDPAFSFCWLGIGVVC